MSLESCRKLGLISSLISILVPVITFALFATYFISIFSFVLSNGSSLANSSLYSLGFSLTFWGLAILAFAGFIIFLVSVHRLSGYYNEPGIFRNVLLFYVLEIVAIVVGVIVFVAAILTSLTTDIQYQYPYGFSTIIVGLLEAAGLFYVISIVGSIFFMRGFNKLADKSGVDNFRTFGLLFLIGVILTPAFIGGLIVWIGWFFGLSGFKNLKPNPTLSVDPPQQPTQVFDSTLAGEKRVCPYCGTENNNQAIYCKACGKQIS